MSIPVNLLSVDQVADIGVARRAREPAHPPPDRNASADEHNDKKAYCFFSFTSFYYFRVQSKN